MKTPSAQTPRDPGTQSRREGTDATPPYKKAKKNEPAKASKTVRASAVGSEANDATTPTLHKVTSSRGAKGKGKGRSDDVGASEASGDAGGSPTANSAKDAPEDVELDAQPIQLEALEAARTYLDDVVRPLLASGMTQETAELYLALWQVAQQLEVLRSPGKFSLRKSSTSYSKLEKMYSWASRSWPAVMSETTTYALPNGRVIDCRYDLIAFFFTLYTAPHLVKVYRSAAAAASKGKLARWSASAEELSLGIAMCKVLTQCCYVLKGPGPYYGMTERSGEVREQEHGNDCVSLKVAVAKDTMPWQNWTREACYVPPPELADYFPAFLLFFIEHGLIVTANAVQDGLNTNMFDLQAYEHIATAGQVKDFVIKVLDDLSPKDKVGVRRRPATGRTLQRTYFTNDATFEKYAKLIPIRPGTMRAIFEGTCWAWHVREILAQEKLDLSIWPTSRLPKSLLPTREERAARSRARNVKKNGFGNDKLFMKGRDVDNEKQVDGRRKRKQATAATEIGPQKARKQSKRAVAGEDVGDDWFDLMGGAAAFGMEEDEGEEGGRGAEDEGEGGEGEGGEDEGGEDDDEDANGEDDEEDANEDEDEDEEAEHE
ncbi:hypothetical protein Rhopal_002050-T1 [Rhodotorula paludigena]|uniref:Uncharacterized protein n=1 Tax=Rhodotorula paludigena TaxID=86838 RepID=A0AAV5G9C8_9BASI|nr:hypothetical protein Rhopal_002050-T1 [Rhodotorula paludigena]